MALKSKYITKDDFKGYFGIDLEKELEGSVDGFLKRNEDLIARFVDYNFFNQVDTIYPTFSDYQKEHYKLALLEQAYYVYRNGDISSDSGYDPENGSNSDVHYKSIAPNAMEELVLCGLVTRKIRWVRW